MDFDDVAVIPVERRGEYGYVQRFVIVSRKTGDILDDCQGFGYKDPDRALRGFRFRCLSDAQKEEIYHKHELMREFLDNHDSLRNRIKDLLYISYRRCLPVSKNQVYQLFVEENVDFYDLPFSFDDFWYSLKKKMEI